MIKSQGNTCIKQRKNAILKVEFVYMLSVEDKSGTSKEWGGRSENTTQLDHLDRQRWTLCAKGMRQNGYKSDRKGTDRLRDADGNSILGVRDSENLFIAAASPAMDTVISETGFFWGYYAEWPADRNRTMEFWRDWQSTRILNVRRILHSGTRRGIYDADRSLPVVYIT